MRYKFNDNDKIYEDFNDIKRAAMGTMLSCFDSDLSEGIAISSLVVDLEEMIEVLECKENTIRINAINKKLENYGFWIECLPDKEILGEYVEHLDMTIIFEYYYDSDGNMTSEEIVGWYMGEPDPSRNEEFYGNLKAVF